jgi:hypothetical protein
MMEEETVKQEPALCGHINLLHTVPSMMLKHRGSARMKLLIDAWRIRGGPSALQWRILEKEDL